MAIPFNDNLHIAAPKPVDKRYLNSNNLPYTNTGEVLSTIPVYERYVGLPVLLTGGVEYWFQPDVNTLVEKTAGSSGSTGGGGTITGATNGLSLVGGGKQIGLGGFITGDTFIESTDGNQSLNIGTVIPLGNFNTIAQYQQRFSLTGDTSYLQLTSSNVQLGATYTGGPTSLIFANTSNAGLLYTNASNINSNIAASDELASISVTNNNNGDNAYIRLRPNGSSSGITVSSTIPGFKGMVYQNDYGDNFGPRSIPDVQWIRDNATTDFTTISAETLTLKSSRDVYNQNGIISTVDDYFADNYGVVGATLPDNDVTFSILDPTQTVLAFGTNGGGFYIVDFNTSISEVFNTSSGNYSGDALPNSITQAVWVGSVLYYSTSDFSGFGRFDYSTLTNERFTPSSGNYTGTILNASTNSIAFDTNSGDDIYFTTATQGFLRYNISGNHCTKYNVTQDTYSGDTLNQLTRGIAIANAQVWVTTVSAGLYRFDPFDNTMVNYRTNTGNYSGDAFLTNNFSNLIVAVGDKLYFSGNRFDTAAISNERLTLNLNYSGDTIGTFQYLTTDGNYIYGLTSNGFSKFNTLTSYNVNATGINGYVNTLGNSIFIYTDPAGLIFDPTLLLITRNNSSAGVGVVASSPSPFEIKFDEHGLNYTSDQSAYFGDRSLVDKGFVNAQIAYSESVTTSQINDVQTDVDAIKTILSPFEQTARPALTTLGQLYYFDFSQSGNQHITTNGNFLFNGGVLQLFSGPGNFSQYATVDQFNQPDYSGDSQNCFEYWKIKAKFKVTSAVGGTTYAFSLGMKSKNGYSKIDMAARLAVESSDFYFYSLLNGSPSQQRPSSGYTTIVQNSTYFFEVERIKNRLYARLYNASNVLQGESFLDYNISLSGNTFWSNNVGVPVIYNHGGSISILDLEVTSNHKKNVDVVAVSDSNGHGLYTYSGKNRARYIEQACNSLGLSFNNFSGVDAGVRDAQKLQRTIKFSNPKYVFINDFSNDIAAGTGFTSQYTSLVTYLKQNIPNVRIIHSTPIARNYNVDTAYTAINPYLSSGDTMVDGFQATKYYTTNQLKPEFDSNDHIHLTEYGHNAMAERLMMALLKEESRTVLYV